MNDSFAGYWAALTAAEKTDLAERADTSVAYLSQVANGHRRAGVKTIRSLTNADKEIKLSWFFDEAA